MIIWLNVVYKSAHDGGEHFDKRCGIPHQI